MHYVQLRVLDARVECLEHRVRELQTATSELALSGPPSVARMVRAQTRMRFSPV
jgi:hypothetical protein